VDIHSKNGSTDERYDFLYERYDFLYERYDFLYERYDMLKNA